jgi:acyl-coenzyme A thioesterase PaaI-like protein
METGTVDYEALKAGLQQAIPFNNHIGLEVAEVGDGRGVVLLPDSEALHNHVGSQHAGALFSAGEAASGAAFVGAFAERMAGITPLARSARID